MNQEVKREAVEYVYSIMHRYYHQICSVIDVIQADPTVNTATKQLLTDIRGDFEADYLEINDAYAEMQESA